MVYLEASVLGLVVSCVNMSEELRLFHQVGFVFKKNIFMFTYFQQSEINAFLFSEPIFFSIVDPEYLEIEFVFRSRSCTSSECV